VVTIREVLLGLLGVLTLGRIRRAVALSLIGAVAVGVVFPPPAQAQLGVVAVIGAANAVLRTINGLIRGLLDGANGLLGDISSIMGAFRNLNAFRHCACSASASRRVDLLRRCCRPRR
jgi:hypothetical protein